SSKSQKRQALLNDCKQEGIIAKYNFKKHYSDSIDYKLRPPYQPSSKEKLVALLDNTIKIYKDILFFTYGDCTKTELNTFAEYVSALDKQTFTKQNIIKNILLNIKYIGVSPKNIKWYFRYPRYRLYYALPYFLFGESNMKKDVTQLLGLDTNVDKKQLFNRFMKLWERFN
ncbi:MAG: hypothetical protein U9O87_00255, partial [Verrucomicrobiota bacterium]|nr:hypothetical protein [Verrucomicrobiota bacterium]